MHYSTSTGVVNRTAPVLFILHCNKNALSHASATSTVRHDT